LETNIHHNNNNFYGYNKRNEFSTIWDDKKVLAEKAHVNYVKPASPYFIGNNSLNTNILPTTSASYGAYYNYGEENKNTEHKRKLFY
jgi:hypothetical protein